MRRLAVTEELNSLRTLERSVEVLGVKHVADVHGDVLAQDAPDRRVRLCVKVDVDDVEGGEISFHTGADVLVVVQYPPVVNSRVRLI